MSLVKLYSIAFDVLLGLNFFGTIGAVFGAAISQGDIKMTVIMGGLNTLVILLARVYGYSLAERRRKKNGKLI